MKKVIIISLFVLGLIIPNINVKAVNVSNEEQLRAAIKQGGDITLTDNIEVTQPLVIDKDVNISGRYLIMMQGDNTLMTVNSGNVTLNVDLYAGWNGKYNKWGYPENVVNNQGTALVVNGGTVNFDDTEIYAGNIGVEVNGGTVTGSPRIYAGEYNYDNNTYSGGQGMIVNGGNVELNDLDIASGGTALTVNNGANVTLNGAEINSYEENGIEVNNGANVTLTAEFYDTIIINSYEGNGIEVNDGSVVNVILTSEHSDININSYERNGIEVNDGSVVNINSRLDSTIFGSKNAIYLNGGSINLNGSIELSSSTEGKGIYINKGVNTVTGGDILNLGKDFVFSYLKGTTPNFSIYVNPDIKELRVTDEKGFMELLDNKLNLGFCGGAWEYTSQTEEERKATCSALDANYDGPIESNELGKCTTVYINGVKQNEPDASCTPVAEDENTENNQGPQIVEVPSTSAYGSIIIIVLGIICVIVSVFVMRRVTKKTN